MKNTEILNFLLPIKKWSKEEDEYLEKSVLLYGKQDWKKIAESISGRSPIQCLHRWSQVLRPGLKRSAWSKEEDAELRKWVQANGNKQWYQAAYFVKGRTPKQCQERWCNILDPELKKEDWSLHEDEILFSFYSEFGPQWNKITEVLPGRSKYGAKKRFAVNVKKLKRGSGSIAKAIIEFEKISAHLKFENQKRKDILKNDLLFELFLAHQGNAIPLKNRQEYDELKEMDNIQNSILSYCQKNIFSTFQDSLNLQDEQRELQKVEVTKNIENDKENLSDKEEVHILLGQLSSLEDLLKTAKNQLFELRNTDNCKRDVEQLEKLSKINMKRKLDLQDLSQNLNKELEKMVKKIKK